VTTSYRDIFLLACCQALLLVNGAGLISMNGLIGYGLAADKSFATLGATTYVLGSALAAMPAAAATPPEQAARAARCDGACRCWW